MREQGSYVHNLWMEISSLPIKVAQKINLAKVSWFWKFSLSSCVPPSEAQVNSDVSSIKPQSDDMMRGRMVMILKKKATYNNKINITLCTYSISLFSIHCSRKYHHSLTVGLLVTEELLAFRGPFLPFLPACDIIRLFKMIVCIKYQTC